MTQSSSRSREQQFEADCAKANEQAVVFQMALDIERQIGPLHITQAEAAAEARRLYRRGVRSYF